MACYHEEKVFETLPLYLVSNRRNATSMLVIDEKGNDDNEA